MRSVYGNKGGGSRKNRTRKKPKTSSPFTFPKGPYDLRRAAGTFRGIESCPVDFAQRYIWGQREESVCLSPGVEGKNLLIKQSRVRSQAGF
jgi:hypothetical protein